MTDSYDLTKLDPHSFEHLVNLLALRVLGPGHTGFGPGADGGRDGYYEGEAPYPSNADRWSGRWYIQSKFHKPHLSRDPQKWLLERIQEELKEFTDPKSKRKSPDNWIVATNIDPSGSTMTGAFDQAMEMVTQALPKLKDRFHIWGGRKILDLLALHPEIVEYYSHFLSPGQVFTALYHEMRDARAEVETILRYLIVKLFDEQKYTKLEQAGSAADVRPGIHKLFIDLPFRANEHDLEGLVTEYLVHTAARSHRVDGKQPETKEWRQWQRQPSRARVWFLKGGPGQGKSTVGQYFCQIQRASLILQEDGPTVLPILRTLATEIQEEADKAGFWPTVPRIPISVELKDFAQWFGQRSSDTARGILTYLAERISANVEQPVFVGTLKRALEIRSWLIVFDGLDEVPHDVKDAVASEVRNFVDHVVMECNSDLLTLCTSRPQGYSGQFAEMDGPTIDLMSLSPDRALQCARPVIELGRSAAEALKSFQTLELAIRASSVRELMTTPLQAHIMAVVVRDGGKPPDRRWQLFTNFYQVIKRREANRELPDVRLAKLLREDEQLLKTVHNRLGFVLHSRAETSQGALTRLDRTEFRTIVADAVSQMIETEAGQTVEVLMEATTDRLVLVSTPDDGNSVRFDIRQLQEFFAAEFLYESVDAEELRERIEVIAGDSHWREVMHFLLSAFVENNRRTDLSIAIQALEHLNEGDGDPHTRLLSRRLARGALLAARLLEEGVLEQDKRIRQQFRNCLEPLAAVTDIGTLGPLVQVRQSNSESWLFAFLLERLREASLTESLGAATVLLLSLPDEHESVEEVRNFVLSAPPSYTGVVLALCAQRKRVEPQSTTQKWVLDTVLKLLLSPRWFLLGAGGVRSAASILRDSTENTFLVASEGGLSVFQIELLREFLETDFPPQGGLELDQDYGLINGSYYPHDWTTGTLEIGSWTAELPPEPSTDLGFLDVLDRIFRFAKERTLSSLTPLLECIEKDEMLTCLSKRITAYLPLDESMEVSEQINELRSLDETELNHLLTGRCLGARRVSRPIQVHLTGSPVFDSQRWEDLLDDLPCLRFSSGRNRSGIDLPENDRRAWIRKMQLTRLSERFYNALMFLGSFRTFGDG